MNKTLLFSALLVACSTQSLRAQETFPKLTVENDTTWYMLSTPERENLFMTNHGAGSNLTGTQADFTDNQLWCFIQQGERVNLLNRADKSYLNDRTTTSNKFYTSVEEAPQTGFSISLVESKNLYNLTDGTNNMLNQCENSNGYKFTTWNYSTDPGNLFKIQEVDINNLEVSQAKIEAETFFNQTQEGTNPGTYTAESRTTFQEALENATTIDEINAALEAYKNSMNWVKEGQLYFIVSSGPNYCRNKVLYNSRPTAGASLRWGDKTTDENALWEFVALEENADGQKTYALKNKATGMYLQATSTAESGVVSASVEQNDLTAFILESLDQDQSFLFYTPNGNPVHAQEAYGFMVTWNNRSYGSASSWKIVAATEQEAADAAAKTISDNENYKMVWQEEFNVDGAVNEKDWNFEYGFVRNNEHQWYQGENASIKDGNLVIEARKERKDNPWYEAGSSDWKKSRQYIDYTSTSMTTANKHDFLYGRLEVRAKIPCYSGSWPAIWLLGYENIAGQWPSSGEIDVMEYYKDKTLANLVWGSSQQWVGIWESRTVPVSNYWVKQNPNWTEEYHVWRMDWDEESIKLYLDDELITICNLSRTVNQGSWHIADNPFHTPQYILLNLALGGNNGGTIDDSKLPFSYLVDYVRVYQKPEHITGIESNLTEDKSPLVYMTDHSCNINTSSFEGEVKATVYNLSGQPVASTKGNAEKASMPLQISHLNKGIYLVRVSDRHQVATEKIIIK